MTERKKGVRLLLGELGRYKWKILLTVLFAAAALGCSLYAPKLVSRVTDAFASGSFTMQFVNRTLLELAGIYLAAAFFGFLRGFVMAGAAAEIGSSLRRRINAKWNVLPLAALDGSTHGEVLSLITNDVDVIEMSIGGTVTNIFSALLSIVGVLVMMLRLNVPLALMILVVVPLCSLGVFVVVKLSQKHYDERQECLAKVNGRVEETCGAHDVVKAYRMEERSLALFSEENQELFRHTERSQFFSGLMMPLVTFVGNVGYVIVCVAGAAFAAAGSMSVGDVAAFMQYVRSFTGPLGELSNYMSQLQRMSASATRISRYLDEPAEPEEPFRAGETAPTGDVEFLDVSFGYGEGDLVIKHFDFTVGEGRKVAIVGETGAGKTTLAGLLMRFFEPKEGEICIAGQNIARMPRRLHRARMGMVLQDAWLFGGTVLDNIRYGSPEATEEQVRHAAELARADSFIRTLPGGYQEEINEESTNLSAGQRQLITIARAFLLDPKILILDEATSSVDTRTERELQQAMDRLMEGRTCFVIAHRLSTVMNADTILFLQDGRIAEQGTHTELLALNGGYAALWRSQFAA